MLFRSLDYSARKRKILRNFDLLLPKFHFILPKFHFGPPWRVFVCSLEILDFLRRYRCMSVDIVMKLGSSHIPQSLLSIVVSVVPRDNASALSLLL